MFLNRKDAGQQLGERLLCYRGEHPVVVALPRGGVPVGVEVAACLDAPLEALVVRKLRAPGQPELAIGALTGGEKIRLSLNRALIRKLWVPRSHIAREVRAQSAAARAMERLYTGGRRGVDVRRRTVIVVDDGLATGETARAALRALRRKNPARLVLAVPVAPRETVDALMNEVDDLISLRVPDGFSAVGNDYLDFGPVSDADVVALLERARQPAMA